MRSILLISNVPIQADRAASDETNILIEALEAVGYIVCCAERMNVVKSSIQAVDAVVMNMPLEDTRHWIDPLMQWKRLPLLWWCSTSTSELSKSFCDSDLLLDGILTPAMKEQELHWALYFAAKHSLERQQWATERKLLEEKLEERKWIELAKGILCKMKNVSEAEAYDMLRKQAMNERKRLVDVASAVVKVYQMLEK